MEGVMDVDTEGSFTQVVAAKEGVAEGVEGGVGTGTCEKKGNRARSVFYGVRPSTATLTGTIK
jgi:hypothetical protein